MILDVDVEAVRIVANVDYNQTHLLTISARSIFPFLHVSIKYDPYSYRFNHSHEAIPLYT